MRPIVLADDFLEGQLPLDRAARAGHAAGHQRLQPAGDQRHPQTTSGTTSPPSRTSSCRRSGRSRSGIRSPAPSATTPLPAGGRGYIRPASLVSVWSTAPFLQNNTRRAASSASPSVEARMRSFQDSIEQMLWPEKRDKDPLFAQRERPRRRRHRSDSRVDSYSKWRRATSPTIFAASSASAAGCFPFLVRQRLLGQDRTVPERDAGRPASRTWICWIRR